MSDRILKLPASLYKSDDSSFMGKLWSVVTPEFDLLETTRDQLANIYDADIQRGVVLDQIGRLLRARRDGRDDASFRIQLYIALVKYLSDGSIPSLIDIGRAIVTDGDYYLTRELCYQSGTALLDGSDVLSGLFPLDPDLKEPAAFEMLFVGNVDTLEVPVELGQAIDEVRAAGVYGKLRVRFRIPLSDMTLYTHVSDTLDGQGLLDGKTLLSPFKKMNVNEVAVGDGAHPGGVLRSPQAGDTGLQNEVLRKGAQVIALDVENDEYNLVIDATEINGVDIDEFGLFSSVGVIALRSFPAKPKTGTILYEFSGAEDL